MKYYKFLIVTVIAFFAFAPFFIHRPSYKTKQQVVAKVGDRVISLKDYKTALLHTYTSFRNDIKAKEKLLNRLIVEELLLDEASHRHITVNENDLRKYEGMINSDYTKAEFEKALLDSYEAYEIWIKTLKRYILIRKVASSIVSNQISINKETMQAYYDAYMENQSKHAVIIAQIFSSSKTKIELAEKKLNEGMDFNKVAKLYSETPEANNGGIIKIQELSAFPKVFNIIHSMKEGSVSPILKSTYGYHIIKLISKNAEIQNNKEMARNYMMLAQGKKIYKKWLADKLKNTKIFKNLALLNSIE